MKSVTRTVAVAGIGLKRTSVRVSAHVDGHGVQAGYLTLYGVGRFGRLNRRIVPLPDGSGGA